MKIIINPGVERFIRLGALCFEDVTVQDSSQEFWRHAGAEFTAIDRNYHDKKPSEIPELQDVRALYRATGIDPTKQRPSCEALLRRIISGKELYRVNNAVDTLNLWSVKLFVPACVHDFDHVSGGIELRIGKAGERYVGIDGKKEVNLDGLLLLSDEKGPFGNPSADSDRTKVTTSTKRVLLILYIPKERSPDWCERALTNVASDFQRWCGGFPRDKFLL